MANETLERVLRGHKEEDHYAVLGAEPFMGGEDALPADRMRAYLVLKGLPTSVSWF